MLKKVQCSSIETLLSILKLAYAVNVANVLTLNLHVFK